MLISGIKDIDQKRIVEVFSHHKEIENLYCLVPEQLVITN